MSYALRTGPLRWHDCPGCGERTLYDGMHCKRTGCGHVIQPPAAKPDPEWRVKPKGRQIPPREDMERLCSDMSFQQLQKHYRTSHRVVRKWLDLHGLRTRGQRG